MPDPQQLYLELYKEYRAELRHQEVQRSTVSTICVSAAGALLGFYFKEANPADQPILLLLLVNFSLVAAVMLRKLYERFELARARARRCLRALDNGTDWPTPFVQEAPRLEALLAAGEQDNIQQYPFLSFVRLHWFWEALLIGAATVGVVLWFRRPPPWLHTHPRLWAPLLLAAGPALQFFMLLAFQRHEQSKETAPGTQAPSQAAARARHSP